MEKISALMDGELDRQNAQSAISQIKQDESLHAEWATYHLIGDALRDHWIPAVDISQKIKARLSQEPTILAPHPFVMEKFKMATLPIAASIAAVSLVGWLAFSSQHHTQEITIASSENPASSTKQTQHQTKPAAAKSKVQHNKQLNEYLLAHQEYSPAMALPGVAPYVQTVAFFDTDR